MWWRQWPKLARTQAGRTPRSAGLQSEERTDRSGARRRRRIGALLFLLAAVVATAIWAVLPIESAPTLAQLLMVAEQWRTSPLAPVVALACFVVGGLLVFPVNLLIAATIVVFGPVAGALLALAGSVASAFVVHELGRRLPAALPRRLLGERSERLRTRIVGHGLLSIAIVRLVPLAPYSVVSLVAGIARIRRLDYLVGTALGMLPGITLYALFAERAREVLLDPHPLAWLGLVGTFVLIVALALAVRFWHRKREIAAGRVP